MLRIALLSRWHVHADDYATQASELGLEFARVWDEDPARGRAWADELGSSYEPDLGAVLRDPGVDAVIVSTPTTRHQEVIVRAARAGKHIFSEKVLAATRTECEAIFAAVDGAGVRLMLSLPRLTQSGYLAAQGILDRGAIGRLTAVRCRVAHDGAVDRGDGVRLPERFFDPGEAAGGALIDLGAHPTYLCNRLAGHPLAVSAHLSSVTGRGVDDNSVALVDYPGGVLGVVETGFVAKGGPFQLALSGTEATVLVEGIFGESVRLVREPGSWEDLEAPAALPSAMEQWLSEIDEGTAPTITRDDMLDLTLVNEAAARSAREGRRIVL